MLRERSNGPERSCDRIPHQKFVTPRSGEVRDREDAFLTNVNSELSDKGFLVTKADDLIA